MIGVVVADEELDELAGGRVLESRILDFEKVDLDKSFHAILDIEHGWYVLGIPLHSTTSETDNNITEI